MTQTGAAGRRAISPQPMFRSHSAPGLAGEVDRPRRVGSGGVGSCENDAAGNWCLLAEDAPDPGSVIASPIDDVASAAEPLEIDACYEAITAAMLGACSAGQPRIVTRQRARVGGCESSRAAHRRGRARGSSRHPRARGERGARPPRRRRRLFSVAGRSGQLLLRLGRSSAGTPSSASP